CRRRARIGDERRLSAGHGRRARRRRYPAQSERRQGSGGRRRTSPVFFSRGDSLHARSRGRAAAARARVAAHRPVRLHSRGARLLGEPSSASARAPRTTRATSPARCGAAHGCRGDRRSARAGHRYRRRSHSGQRVMDGPDDRMTQMHIQARSQTTKYIFVTGGVVSSLGKGIAAASLGRLLVERGLRVSMLKFDPYINVDPGTMSPFQHGEVFVTDDGAETDLDLGHYERFIDRALSQANNVTTGRIYLNVITKERRGEFLGSTVQVIPHITDEIKSAIRRLSPENDVIVVEV